MLQELRKQIVDGLEQTRKRGELTAKDVHDIVRDAVVHSTESLKEGAKEVRKISREAISSAVTTLEEAGEATHDTVAAAVTKKKTTIKI